MKASAIPVDTDGIDPARVYPLRVFMRLAGMGQAAMRAARRDGLPVHYLGNVAFVRGSDFATHLASNSSSSHRRSDSAPGARHA
jgi:hypothetical protein